VAADSMFGQEFRFNRCIRRYLPWFFLFSAES